MIDLLIFDVKRDAMTSKLEKAFRSFTDYCFGFKKHFIIIIIHQHYAAIDKFVFGRDHWTTEGRILENNVRDKLIKKLLKDFPEISLMLFECSDKTLIIKIRKDEDV